MSLSLLLKKECGMGVRTCPNNEPDPNYIIIFEQICFMYRLPMPVKVLIRNNVLAYTVTIVLKRELSKTNKWNEPKRKSHDSISANFNARTQYECIMATINEKSGFG